MSEEDALNNIKYGDLVICRYNKPMLGIAYGLLKGQKNIKLLGFGEVLEFILELFDVWINAKKRKSQRLSKSVGYYKGTIRLCSQSINTYDQARGAGLPPLNPQGKSQK